MSQLDARSEARLRGVHPHLIAVVRRCAEIGGMPFIVTEGVRTLMRQAELVRAGASRTMKSRHLTGHAVDLAVLLDDEVRWDWPLYHQLAAKMKASARALAISLEWGGDWTSFPDGPHFQLPWREYPDESAGADRQAA
jgi:peptidoglycan L-alanyl-D-glutamate endopeptidase CwlK